MTRREPPRSFRVGSLCWHLIVFFVEISLIAGLKRIKEREELFFVREGSTSTPVRSRMTRLATVAPSFVFQKRRLDGEAQDLRPSHVIDQTYVMRAGGACLEVIEQENVGIVERFQIHEDQALKNQTVIVFRMSSHPIPAALSFQPPLFRVRTLTGELPGSNDRPYERVERFVTTLSERGHQHRRLEYEYVTAQSMSGDYFPVAAYPIEIEGTLSRLRLCP